ncbi:MAG: tRNA (adenosine(37)-N6)-threonylcarbamoyltransferase complex dimerization subunit type 1 TsaB [Bacteroidota bacterium]
MAKIVYLETATQTLSVALAENTTLLALKETRVANSHSQLVTVFVQQVLAEAGMTIEAVDAVVVSQGPGSYTGLRIGVSTAKGLCFALGKPLIAVGTLQAMGYGARINHNELPADTIICPMLDARRMEVYYALFDNQLNEIKPDEAAIITDTYFDAVLKTHRLLLLGDGAEKCRELFDAQPKIELLTDFNMSARYMIEPGLKKFENQTFENVAYFEPFYLKDFVAGKANVKGLHG